MLKITTIINKKKEDNKFKTRISCYIDYLILEEEIIYWYNKASDDRGSIINNYFKPEYTYQRKMYQKKQKEFFSKYKYYMEIKLITKGG